MADSLPMEIASTIQSASIKHNPDVQHDLNPSTSASKKEPVTVSQPSTNEHFEDSDEYGIDEGEEEEEEEEDIPYSTIRSLPRTPRMPPLPDLRFEQSYLASIANAQSNWRIAWITTRDQLLLPLLQGTLWSLLQLGWRHWNATANLSGATLGSRLRRWWYKTNNWSLPPFAGTLNNMKKGISNVTKDNKLADEMAEVSRALLHSFVLHRHYFALGFLREFSCVWNFWG